MKVHRLHVEAVNDWNGRMTQQGEDRAPDQKYHLICESVMRRPKEGPAQTRPKVSRQQPSMHHLSDATDYWGGDKNADTGEPRTVLHFAMKHYVEQHVPQLGQYGARF